MGIHFNVQDERANAPFDTLGLLGWDADAGRYLARSIQDLGVARERSVVPGVAHR